MHGSGLRVTSDYRSTLSVLRQSSVNHAVIVFLLLCEFAVCQLLQNQQQLEIRTNVGSVIHTSQINESV